MNSTTVEINLALVAVILSAAAALVAWLGYARAKDWRQSDAGKDTSQKLGAHSDRLTRLETRMEDIPSKADIAALRGQITTLKAELDGVQTGLTSVAAGVERIEQFLMQGQS